MTKVLVAYASKHGATVEIAEAVADKMRERHLSVDCRPAHSVENLFGYDAVIVGSAVYFGRWRPDAMRFLRRHASRLADLPVWTFSSGPVGSTPASGELEPHGERLMAERLHARGHVVFGGRVQAGGHGVLRPLVDRIPRPYRDRRDWAEIRAWAATIAGELEREQAPASDGASVV
ncbi:MAG TPA: flavodoxin domain-containing protein [Solirubrobacteraceae bacterium]|nr:flavodoxin domain-containing protein [Solirubrobacteraceae bacterium]